MPRRRSTVSLRLVRRAALFVTPAIFLACTGEDVAGPTTGTFEVRTITTGPLPADSYTLMWDGVDHGTVGVAAAVILREVPPGSHTVGLAGVPANCEVKGANPQTVAVPAGQTLTVVFEIACAIVPNAGTLLITTATTGFDLDPNGFFVVMHTVGQLQDVARGIGANDTLVRNNVTAGALRVELSGLADNCAVQGINPREVAVTAEATTEIDFVVLCAATTGSVKVSTTTTGSSLDPDGYSVGMSYSTPISIGINDSLTASGLFPNERAVGLSGIAENCAVQNKNPQEVSIVAGERTTVSFTVLCRTPVEAHWAQQPSGTTLGLTRLSGTSASNVFAAGGEVGNCPSYCATMTILHYDGQGWSTQLTHAGTAFDVWAASPVDAFARADGFPGPLLHYDGTQWSPMASPAINVGDEGNIFAVWGLSGHDVFAVGDTSDGNNTLPYMAHFDGRVWAPMHLPDIGWLSILDIWGTSPENLYAVGYSHYPDGADYDTGYVLHFDGHQWSEVFDEWPLRFVRVWGSGPTDVYAVGATNVPNGLYGEFTGHGAIRHFDGTSWSAVPSPTSLALRAIWGSSPTDVYVLASGAQPGSIWHFDGLDWTPLHVGAGSLFDIWGSSAADVFAVGLDGIILHRP